MERQYSDAYYEFIDGCQHAVYDRLADAIMASVKPTSVVDVGCGSGYLLSRLAMSGVAVCGVEGSRHAIRRSPVARSIVRHNLVRPIPRLGRFDLCICIEVAEHLPKRSAPTLVRSLSGLSDEIIFSAATPGQGGVNHLNEQPHSFWVELFGSQRFVKTSFANHLRDQIADLSDAPWIAANLLSFHHLPYSPASDQ